MNSEDTDTQNNSSSGRWTAEEQYLYEQYVKAHPDHFTKQTSKGLRAFKRMAQVIKTRTAVQCRSHHQKMTIRGVRRHKRNSTKKSIPIQVKTVEIESEVDHSAEVSDERTEKYYAERLTASINEPELPDLDMQFLDYGVYMGHWMYMEPHENDFIIGDWGVRIPRTV